MNFLALFMKSPESGMAKRRLRSVLSEEEVTRLCEAFAEDLLEKLVLLPCDKKVIAYAGEPPTFIPTEGSWSLYPQTGEDLGERLQNYFRWSFTEGAAKSVVIGSDSPTLPRAYLEEAFALLGRYETVLGPSEDGGYYLIGMRRFNPTPFQEIPWGTERVFEETVKRVSLSSGPVGILDRWYDVDTPNDLKRLRRHLAQMEARNETEMPPRTHRVLSEMVF